MAFPLLEICKQPRLMALVTNPERKLCAPKHTHQTRGAAHPPSR